MRPRGPGGCRWGDATWVTSTLCGGDSGSARAHDLTPVPAAAQTPSCSRPPPAPGVPAVIADERKGVRLGPGAALSGVSGFGRVPHPVDHWESWEEPSKLPLSVLPLKRVIWYLNEGLETSEAEKNLECKALNLTKVHENTACTPK